MIIGIPIYQKVDRLDVAGPYEVFNWMKQFAPALKAEVYLVAAKPGLIKTRDGLVMKPHKVFREVPKLDVLWVPGGDPSALNKLTNDPARTCLNFLFMRSRKPDGSRRFAKALCSRPRLECWMDITSPRIGPSSPA